MTTGTGRPGYGGGHVTNVTKLQYYLFTMHTHWLIYVHAHAQCFVVDIISF